MTQTDQQQTPPAQRSQPAVFVLGPILLYLLPLPLLPASFVALLRGNLQQFLGSATAIALVALSIALLRKGQRRQLELGRLRWSRIANRPWKTSAAFTIGLAVSLCSLLVVALPLWAALSFGLIGVAGVLLSYGSDGTSMQQATEVPTAPLQPEVIAALEEARSRIATIDSANQQIHNSELNRRIRRINARAVDILTLIADDPSALRRARRFLNVYLEGAQRVTEGYAQSHQAQQNKKLEQNFRNVLITIEDAFDQQYDKLKERELVDLDVQIEVLTTQLKNEGVR